MRLNLKKRGNLRNSQANGGDRLEEELVESAQVEEVVLEEVVEAPSPPKPLVVKETKEEIKAHERLKALERFLASAARPPIVLRDPGLGETLEEYSIGLARVRIALDEAKGVCWYFVDEPQLEPLDVLAYSLALESIYMKADIPEEAVKPAKRKIIEDIMVEPPTVEVGEIVREHVKSAFSELKITPDLDRINRVCYYINRELFLFSVLNTAMEDPYVEDINVIGPRIYVGIYHRKFSQYRWLWSNMYFRDDDELNDFMNRLAHAVGQGLTVAKPYADFALPSGDRFAGILGREITAKGPTLTIRKFATSPYSLPYLVSGNMLSDLMAAYLWFALEQKAIIGIAGPTGSGKTTLFNALLACLHPNSTIYTIEDVYELYLPHRGWRPTTTRRSSAFVAKEFQISESELIKMALRMRPDYIVVGEVRSEDAIYHLLNAAFTGHGGGFTFHSGSAEEFYSRLAIMLQKAGMSEALLTFFWGCAITSYYDTPKARLRRVTEVAEIIPKPDGGYEVEKIFTWNGEKDRFYPETGDELFEKSKRLQMLTSKMGFSKERVLHDIEAKRRAIREGVRLSINTSRGFYEFLAKREWRKEVWGV